MHFLLLAALMMQQVPKLAATPDLRVDPADASIDQGAGMLVAPNGDILVIDGKDDIFRVFNAHGPAGTIGRSGEGPGEFRNLRSAGWLGDSIWTLDPSLNRLSIFGPDRKFKTSMPVPGAIVASHQQPGDSGHLEPYFQAALPGRSLRVVVTYRPAARPSWARDVDSGMTLLVRATSTGVVTNRVLVQAKSMCRKNGSTSKMVYTVNRLFCRLPIYSDWGTTPTNVVTGVNYASDDPQSRIYRVMSVNELGVVRFNRTYPFQPVPISKASVDSAAAARDKSLARFPEMVAAAKALPVPTSYEPIREVVDGRDGTVWLEERIAGPGHQWRVLDAKGNPIGTLTLPQNVSLQAADRQNVWGFETDDDGLQGVVRYRLGRAN